jgi:hypothetical protein
LVVKPRAGTRRHGCLRIGKRLAGTCCRGIATRWLFGAGLAILLVFVGAAPALAAGPTVTAGATATFTGGSSTVALDRGVTLGSTTGNLNSATAEIDPSEFMAGDILNVDLLPSAIPDLTVGYDALTGVMTLSAGSGGAPVAEFQTALQSIIYSFSPSNGDPTADGTDKTRTIDWSVTDTNDVTDSSDATSTRQEPNDHLVGRRWRC